MTRVDPETRLKLIKKYGTNPYSTLLMEQDISAFPLASVEGFIGYKNHHAMPLVLGEPVCAPQHYRAAIQEFMAACQGKNKSFFQICCGDPYMEAVKDLSFSTLFIGDNFIFNPSTYSVKGNQAKPIRWSSGRAIRSGVSVKEYNPRESPDPALEAALNALARRWKKKVNRVTAHLSSLNLFENRLMKRYFYAELGGTPLAMIIALPIFGQDGYLFADVIRDPECPPGCIELITLKILECLKNNDCGKMATFGISPRLEANGYTGTTRVLVKTTMWCADHLFRLGQLNHFRKKFHANRVEPLYALKYPKGFNVVDCARIITLF